MWQWFLGQDIVVKIGLGVMACALAFGLFTMIGGVGKHGTNVAVEQAAEAGAAKAVAEGQKEVLQNVEKANAADTAFEVEQRIDDGRSCVVWRECVRSARNPAEACQRFLPYRQDGKPVDCAATGP